MRNADFDGINVTIPYKKAVIPYCKTLSAQAKRLGAVNTIVKQPDGSLLGHNTDYFGFLTMLNSCNIDPKDKKALVLGTGGAGITACAVLEDLGADVISVSRGGENNYQNITNHNDASILVNATPVGMYPNCGISPVDLDSLPQLECVLDMIYNPACTKLLMDAEKRSITAINGLTMLVAQAKESSQWFAGCNLPDSVIASIVNDLKSQMKNVILIGMPGCGKSTLGKLLAEQLNKRFFDADACIAEKAGKSIPDIFAEGGEDAFRNLEAEVLADLGKQSSLVIATGGGCVTRPENYDSLHQNGTILWIKRDVYRLPTDGRPLSQVGRLEAMYKAREPLYRAFADASISNDTTIDAALEALTQALKETSL
jgi:shikimate dehydrogenase